jgi:hypothetical protein
MLYSIEAPYEAVHDTVCGSFIRPTQLQNIQLGLSGDQAGYIPNNLQGVSGTSGSYRHAWSAVSLSSCFWKPSCSLLLTVWNEDYRATPMTATCTRRLHRWLQRRCRMSVSRPNWNQLCRSTCWPDEAEVHLNPVWPDGRRRGLYCTDVHSRWP